jgi:hypothetical protein
MPSTKQVRTREIQMADPLLAKADNVPTLKGRQKTHSAPQEKLFTSTQFCPEIIDFCSALQYGSPQSS